MLNTEVDEQLYSTQVFDNTLDMIEEWLEKNDDNLVIDNVDNNVLTAVFKKIFRFAPAAGGLVTVNSSILAIERNGIPDLPKGHIEKNETPEMAALREVKEETAMENLKIIKELPSTHHCYKLNGEWIIKKTSWFLMSSDNVFNPKPQREEGISEVFLINENNVGDFLQKTYSSIRLSLENEIVNILKSIK